MVESRSGRTLFSLEAEELVRRKRRSLGGLLVYYDLKEIHLSGATLAVQLPERVADAHGVAAAVTDLVFDSLQALDVFGGERASLEAHLASDTDFDRDILTGVRFHELRIHLQPPDREAFSLHAPSAEMSIGSKSLLLRGSVTVTSSDRTTIRASEALWSSEFSGLLFPKGYTLGESQHSRGFFVVRGDGTLSRIAPAPDVEYRDLVSEKEQLLIARLSRSAPAGPAQLLVRRLQAAARGSGTEQAPATPPAVPRGNQSGARTRDAIELQE